MDTSSRKLTVFFDGTCDFCTRCVRWLRRADRHGRIAWVPFQQDELRSGAGLSVEQCERSVWAIGPGGTRAAGAEAFNVILSTIFGTRLPLRLYRLPGLRQTQEWAYRLIAANRHRLPGDTPYCRQFPQACGAHPRED